MLHFTSNTKVCGKLGDKAVFQEIDVSGREAARVWGLSDGVFVDGKNIYQEPPLTNEQLRKFITKKAREPH